MWRGDILQLEDAYFWAGDVQEQGVEIATFFFFEEATHASEEQAESQH